MVFIKYINGSERMEKFEEAITNYIEKDENFALFVDGEWGTGKTHFFEHDYLLRENLKQGISNIFKLFEVKFLNTENITASIDDYLESKVRDKIKVKLNKNGGRVVFIIDDIERLSDRISLKEFLGFIRNVLL